jgi:23S rRNA pseudouridine1911/1915/1917 synthase
VTPEEGEINIPVGRLPWNRRQFGVVAGGREALTRYKVVSHLTLKVGKKKEIVSLVDVFPETGRTHQIRVHMKYLNHPVFADFLYAGRKTSRDDRMLLERVFLHAHTISFNHPQSNERISLSSPLPPELQTVLDQAEK